MKLTKWLHIHTVKIKKKTSKTKLYQLGEKLLAKTEHCLLLTATPHKGDPKTFDY